MAGFPCVFGCLCGYMHDMCIHHMRASCETGPLTGLEPAKLALLAGSRRGLSVPLQLWGCVHGLFKNVGSGDHQTQVLRASS